MQNCKPSARTAAQKSTKSPLQRQAYILAILLLAAVSCRTKPTYDCSKEIKDGHIGFMLQGGILDKYDNGRVFVSIVHIVNPKDLDFNEYFTGDGFSKNENEVMKVIEKDSCQLKEKYFEYLESQHSR